MKEIRSVDISGKLSPASIHSIEKAGKKCPFFFRNADLGNTDSIAETDSARMFIYYFYSMGGHAIESLASHVNGAK